VKMVLAAAVLAILLTASLAAAATKLEPIRQVAIGKHAEFRVNGKPFLPIMVWLADPRYYPAIAATNVNTLTGYPGDNDPGAIVAYGEEAWKAGFYFVAGCEGGSPDAGYRKLIASPNLLGWIQGDEPDLARTARDAGAARKEPRATPDEIMAAYRATRALDPSRPVFMTLTAAFMKSDTTWDRARKAKMYPALVQACDVVGFDIYPIYGFGTPGRLHDVADGTSELKALAGPHRPIYAWIEANKGSRWMTASRQPDVEPEHTRAEVWMAIIRGATAIGYFTHKWVDADGTENYSSFAPTEEMQAEMRRLNEQLTRLAPAILADPAKAAVRMSMSDDFACHLKATELDGSLYLFAQNIDLGEGAERLKQFDPISPRPGTATIAVGGLKPGTRIEVVDESRTLTSAAGRFTDEFGPLAQHIYRIPWPRK
jgi:hypothetical protein